MAKTPLPNTPSFDELWEARTKDLIEYVYRVTTGAKPDTARLVIERRFARRLQFVTWVLAVLTGVLIVATITLINAS